MPGIVAQEADLREHDGQEHGHGQLPPRKHIVTSRMMCRRGPGRRCRARVLVRGTCGLAYAYADGTPALLTAVRRKLSRRSEGRASGLVQPHKPHGQALFGG
jgi:uncharacterized protein YbaR (Trm112 family)